MTYERFLPGSVTEVQVWMLNFCQLLDDYQADRPIRLLSVIASGANVYISIARSDALRFVEYGLRQARAEARQRKKKD